MKPKTIKVKITIPESEAEHFDARTLERILNNNYAGTGFKCEEVKKSN